MPRPYVRRRKAIFLPKPQEQDTSGDDAYFQVMLKFHEGLLSIVKSIFVCLFVFAATPIAMLASSNVVNFKQHVSEIVNIAGEMLLYCLLLFLMYILFVAFFDLKSRSTTYLTGRLKYMNSIMGLLSFVLVVIASARCLYLYSSIIESIWKQ